MAKSKHFIILTQITIIIMIMMIIIITIVTIITTLSIIIINNILNFDHNISKTSVKDYNAYTFFLRNTSLRNMRLKTQSKINSNMN